MGVVALNSSSGTNPRILDERRPCAYVCARSPAPMSEPFSSLKRARGREEDEYEAECGSPLEDECNKMEAGVEAEESEPT